MKNRGLDDIPWMGRVLLFAWVVVGCYVASKA